MNIPPQSCRNGIQLDHNRLTDVPFAVSSGTEKLYDVFLNTGFWSFSSKTVMLMLVVPSKDGFPWSFAWKDIKYKILFDLKCVPSSYF